MVEDVVNDHAITPLVVIIFFCEDISINRQTLTHSNTISLPLNCCNYYYYHYYFIVIVIVVIVVIICLLLFTVSNGFMISLNSCKLYSAQL